MGYGLLLGAIMVARPCSAQYLPSVSGTPRAPIDVPQTNLTPIPPSSYGGFGTPAFGGQSFNPPPYTAMPYAPAGNPSVYAPPAASLGSPLFDPYATGANPGTFTPAMTGATPVPSSQFPGWLSGNQSAFGAAPNFGPGNPGFSSFDSPAFPSSAYPAGSPNTLFPGGLFNGGTFTAGGGGAVAPRFFQGPRLRFGWLIDGRGPSSLDMKDIDSSLVFALPNFLHSGQPIYLVPSFGIHILSGPDGVSGADMPPTLYDAFLDTGWQSDPNQLLGADLGLRVGVFSDFSNTGSDSLRVLGKAIATFRLTPYSTLKGGVVFLDRNKVNALPAGGILYQPTPLTRYDIYFPQPKLSQYFTTIGTQDVWGYVAGDYGGGSWAIRRADGRNDQVDINDYRVIVGAEWGRNELIRTGRHTGFIETGFVFGRELVYKRDFVDNQNLGNSVMFRAGFGY